MSAISARRVGSPRLNSRLSRLRQQLIWLGVLGVVFGGVTYKLGLLAGLAALAGVLAIPLLLNNARAAFALWLVTFVIAENTADWNIAIMSKLYDKTPLYFSINFLLLLLAAAAVLLDIIRPGVERHMPRPFGPALTLTFLAVVFGFANGALGPGIPKFVVLGSIQTYGTLLIAPFLVVNVVRTRRDLDRFLALLAALTILKSVLGVLAVFGGLTVQETGVGRLSYLAPTINWMEMTYVLVVVAAKLSRTRLPGWVLWSTPVVLASFLLGQRRSFWLAAVFTLVLVYLIASGQTGRRLLLPALAATVLVIYLAVATGLVGPVQGTLISRATSITPTKVTTNTEDRYRLAELQNVVPAIERQPLEGLGLGVQWPETSPLPFEFPFNHYFSHVAFLYWWMTCGLMGAVAYLFLMGSAIVTGVRAWWRARDHLLRVVGLAIGLGVIGMMVVEFTTTVVGNDVRGTGLIATAIGVLAVIYRMPRDEHPVPAVQAHPEITPHGAKMAR